MFDDTWWNWETSCITLLALSKRMVALCHYLVNQDKTILHFQRIWINIKVTDSIEQRCIHHLELVEELVWQSQKNPRWAWQQLEEKDLKSKGENQKNRKRLEYISLTDKLVPQTNIFTRITSDNTCTNLPSSFFTEWITPKFPNNLIIVFAQNLNLLKSYRTHHHQHQHQQSLLIPSKLG